MNSFFSFKNLNFDLKNNIMESDEPFSTGAGNAVPFLMSLQYFILFLFDSVKADTNLEKGMIAVLELDGKLSVYITDGCCDDTEDEEIELLECADGTDEKKAEFLTEIYNSGYGNAKS